MLSFIGYLICYLHCCTANGHHISMSIIIIKHIIFQNVYRTYVVMCLILSFYFLQKDVEFIVYTDVEDYNGTNITVEVSAGVLTQSFTIDIIDNDVVECDEVFSVTIESVTTCGVTTGNCISSNVTIMDDDGE